VIPRQSNEPSPEWDNWIDDVYDKPQGAKRLSSSAWPTVAEVNDTFATARLTTGLQILKGEGVYYGLEYLRPADVIARRARVRWWQERDLREYQRQYKRWLTLNGMPIPDRVG
jgi:hypothetical protein